MQPIHTISQFCCSVSVKTRNSGFYLRVTQVHRRQQGGLHSLVFLPILASSPLQRLGHGNGQGHPLHLMLRNCSVPCSSSRGIRTGNKTRLPFCSLFHGSLAYRMEPLERWLLQLGKPAQKLGSDVLLLNIRPATLSQSLALLAQYGLLCSYLCWVLMLKTHPLKTLAVRSSLLCLHSVVCAWHWAALSVS